MNKLKKFIKFTDERRNYEEIFRDLISNSSRELVDQYFGEIESLFSSTLTLKDILDEMKNKETILFDNLLYKEVKLLNWKFIYEFERLKYQLKISEEATMSEVQNRVESMTIHEIISFT